MEEVMKISNWQCIKCNYHACDVDKISTTGGMLTKWFNIQNKKFSTVTCKKCKYTELYKATTNQLENIFDFLSG